MRDRQHSSGSRRDLAACVSAIHLRRLDASDAEPVYLAVAGNGTHVRMTADAFRLIRSYSPYDQLKPGAYPPMLVTAGLNDPRVTYWEPATYVAKLRTLKTDDNLLLLKTNMGAGHGGKSGRFDSLREVAEEYAFFLAAMALVE